MSNLLHANMEGIKRTLLSLSPALLFFSPVTAVQSVAYAILSLNVYNQFRERCLQMFSIDDKIVDDYNALKQINRKLVIEENRRDKTNQPVLLDWDGFKQEMAAGGGETSPIKPEWIRSRTDVIDKAKVQMAALNSKLKSLDEETKGRDYDSIQDFSIETLNNKIKVFRTEVNELKKQLKTAYIEIISSSQTFEEAPTSLTEFIWREDEGVKLLNLEVSFIKSSIDELDKLVTSGEEKSTNSDKVPDNKIQEFRTEIDKLKDRYRSHTVKKGISSTYSSISPEVESEFIKSSTVELGKLFTSWEDKFQNSDQIANNKIKEFLKGINEFKEQLQTAHREKSIKLESEHNDETKLIDLNYQSADLARRAIEIKIRVIEKECYLMRKEVSRRQYENYFKELFSLVEEIGNTSEVTIKTDHEKGVVKTTQKIREFNPVDNFPNVIVHNVPLFYYISCLLFNPTRLVAWLRPMNLISWVNYNLLGANYNTAGELEVNYSHIMMVILSLGLIAFNIYYPHTVIYGTAISSLLSDPMNYLAISSVLLLFRDFNAVGITFKFIFDVSTQLINVLCEWVASGHDVMRSLCAVPRGLWGKVTNFVGGLGNTILPPLTDVIKGLECLSFMGLMAAALLTTGDVQLIVGMMLNISLAIRQVESKGNVKNSSTWVDSFRSFLMPRGSVIDNIKKIGKNSSNIFQLGFALIINVSIFKFARLAIPRCPGVYTCSAKLCQGLLSKSLGVISPYVSHKGSEKVTSTIKTYQ